MRLFKRKTKEYDIVPMEGKKRKITGVTKVVVKGEIVRFIGPSCDVIYNQSEIRLAEMRKPPKPVNVNVDGGTMGGGGRM